MKRIPDRIYLQFHGQDSCELPDTDLELYDEESEVTWCEDRINDTDVEYIRRPSHYVNVLGCHGGSELRDRLPNIKKKEE